MASLEQLQAHLDMDEGSKVHYRNGRYYPYIDTVGKVTIAMGRNLTDRGISETEKHVLAWNDMADAVAEAGKYPWYALLDDSRQGVIVMMIFNLGAASFAGFHDTHNAIADGRYADAAAAMAASRWATQTGHRAEVYEDIMRTGVWQ